MTEETRALEQGLVLANARVLAESALAALRMADTGRARRRLEGLVSYLASAAAESAGDVEPAGPVHTCSNDCEHAIRAVDNFGVRWTGGRQEVADRWPDIQRAQRQSPARVLRHLSNGALPVWCEGSGQPGRVDPLSGTLVACAQDGCTFVFDPSLPRSVRHD